MEDSILKSTKKMIGVGEDFTSFDLDILTSINSAMSVINQLGIGPINGVVVVDDTMTWASLGIPENQLNLVKTYVYLRVRMLFDPPTTSFDIDAKKAMIEEHEVRLTIMRDEQMIAEALEEV